ncbi:hypothetical protein [Chelatococcus sp. GW1]|uniref:hypothetical protein n=1 Tax=Chelatococcus sp. GW1 TaxID=1211115 RepID=UPI0012E2B203|nr:hypothetical protein [Chelatococcus sp. GW1]
MKALRTIPQRNDNRRFGTPLQGRARLPMGRGTAAAQPPDLKKATNGDAENRVAFSLQTHAAIWQES